MSLSQKHAFKIFVPWFNSAEWKYVYNLLFSRSDQNYRKALHIIKIWKSRTPLLSAGIEGTLIILNALLKDKHDYSEDDLNELYGVAIMRFLNVCATNNDKQGTFYRTAVRNELPKWLINIRHDIAHSHEFPSIVLLELGLKECLEWIKVKYWQVHKEAISDYVVSEADSPAIIQILEIYIELNSNLSLNDSDYDQNLIKKLDTLVSTHIDQSTADISHIIGLIEENLDEHFSQPMNKQNKKRMLDMIVNALLVLELETTTAGTRTIPKEIKSIWSNLLNILNENNLLFLVIDQLIDITNNVQFGNDVREIAALWIYEIFLGLKKTQLLKEKLENAEQGSSQLKLKIEFEENHPEYEGCLEFISMSESCSSDTVKFQEKVLKMPNEYILNFLERVLQFSKKSEDYIKDTINVVKNMLLLDKPTGNNKIFTIDDMEVTLSSSTRMDDSEIQEIVDLTIEPKQTRWKLIEDTSVFNGCPIGILPHQNRDKNPFITFD